MLHLLADLFSICFNGYLSKYIAWELTAKEEPLSFTQINFLFSGKENVQSKFNTPHNIEILWPFSLCYLEIHHFILPAK